MFKQEGASIVPIIHSKKTADPIHWLASTEGNDLAGRAAKNAEGVTKSQPRATPWVN